MWSPWRLQQRLIVIGLACFVVLAAALSRPGAVRSLDAPTPQPVWVEAIGSANVRTGPSLDYPQMGTIQAGTKYRMVGRSSHARWYLIALPRTYAWVYVDLVKVTGDVKTVPWDETVIVYIPPTDTPPPVALTATAPGPTPTPYPTLTLPASTGVTAEALNATIVRYGPSGDFPRVGRISRGQLYPVLHRHAHANWLEIAYPGVAAGRGWVYKDEVSIKGDLNAVPVTNDTSFGYPTLTPTPLMVVTSMPAWTVTPVVGPNEVLEKLSNDIYTYLFSQHFEPGTERQGSVFVMNLKTGHMFSVNPNVAYSAASLMKIPVLVSLYRKFGGKAPTDAEAKVIASMMVCSQNESANAGLRYLGGGDLNKGIAYMMETLRNIGLTFTILNRPFSDVAPTSAPAASAGQAGGQAGGQPRIDQVSAQPDPLNETTPAEIGWLLSGIYRCAVDGTGPLTAAYPAVLTPAVCREMVTVMRANKINTMIEAGVPDGIQVAHKQGWDEHTHGDAALITTPGGDYVLVVMLHSESYLGFDSSVPTVAEISRMTYNVFNASRVLDAIHPASIPECNVSPDLVSTLRSGDAPAVAP